MNYRKLLAFLPIFIFIIGFVCLGYDKAEKQTENVNLKYKNCELGDLVGEDVKRIKVSGYFVDFHSDDYTTKQAKDMAKSCLKDGIKTQYEMDCCLSKKMFE